MPVKVLAKIKVRGSKCVRACMHGSRSLCQQSPGQGTELVLILVWWYSLDTHSRVHAHIFRSPVHIMCRFLDSGRKLEKNPRQAWRKHANSSQKPLEQESCYLYCCSVMVHLWSQKVFPHYQVGVYCTGCYAWFPWTWLEIITAGKV